MTRASYRVSCLVPGLPTQTGDCGDRKVATHVATPSSSHCTSPRGGGAPTGEIHVSAAAHMSSSFKKSFPVISVSIEPRRWTTISSERVCDLVLSSGTRTFLVLSSTVSVHCPSENWSVIYIRVFCILVCLKWPSILRGSSLFVTFGCPVF